MAIVYLASPYGFSDATRGYLKQLREALRSEGHEVNDPWEYGAHWTRDIEEAEKMSDPKRIETLKEIGRRMGGENREALERSRVVVAVLDGADVDSGTASEIGYAFGRGKRIVGYRGDLRKSGEFEGLVVNLQVRYWIVESGGVIVKTVEDVKRALSGEKEGG